MQRPLYREILSASWRMTRQAPWLWLFGMFAFFLGQTGAPEIFLRVLYSPAFASFTRADIFARWAEVRAVIGLAEGEAVIWLFILSALLLVFAAFAVFIAVTSNGALILGVHQYHKHGRLLVGQLWQRAAKKFLPLLAVTALFKISVLILVWLMGLPLDLIARGAAGPGLAVFFPVLFVAVSLAAVILSFLSVYAAAFILIKNKSVGEAVVLGWRLLLDNWLVSLELAFIIFGLSALLTALILAGLLIILLPLFFVLIFSQAVLLPVLGGFAASVAFLIFILLAYWLMTLFTVFQTACWTLLFSRLAEGRAASKLIRFFNGLFSTTGYGQ